MIKVSNTFDKSKNTKKRLRLSVKFLFRILLVSSNYLSNDVYETHPDCWKIDCEDKDNRKADPPKKNLIFLSMTTKISGGDCQTISHRLSHEAIWPLQAVFTGGKYQGNEVDWLSDLVDQISFQ